MDVLSSAKFRKTYAKLTEPTRVTVNGHPIGEWHPMSPGHRLNVAIDEADRAMQDFGRAFNTRPFTPVPKIRPK